MSVTSDAIAMRFVPTLLEDGYYWRPESEISGERGGWGGGAGEGRRQQASCGAVQPALYAPLDSVCEKCD